MSTSLVNSGSISSTGIGSGLDVAGLITKMMAVESRPLTALQTQASTLGKLIWSVPEIIEHLSKAWALAPGDLIFTGTPEGVAAVAVGDRLSARIEGLGSLEVDIVAS